MDYIAQLIPKFISQSSNHQFPIKKFCPSSKCLITSLQTHSWAKSSLLFVQSTVYNVGS